MPNIRLREAPLVYPNGAKPFAIFIDFVEGKKGLEDSHDLQTAVIVALATDGLAAVTDTLPDPLSNDREGWWGDVDAPQIWNGWPVGTRLWTMRRDAIRFAGSRQGSTVAKAVDFASQSIQPFVDNGIISSFTVTAQTDSIKSITLQITMFRAQSPAVSLQYEFLWDQLSTKRFQDPFPVQA